MKKILFVLTLIISVFLLNSCSSLNPEKYVAKYNIPLTSVESPSDARNQYSKVQINSLVKDDINYYQYEDSFINIIWYVSPKEFAFELTNKSDHPIKINWDDISYVDYTGSVGRVMHSGVKYVDKNNSQPATTIPRGASLTDTLLPVDNVYYGSYIHDWIKNYLLPCRYKDQSSFSENAEKNIGRTMKILMPIVIESIQNDYVFEFTVKELLNPELGISK